MSKKAPVRRWESRCEPSWDSWTPEQVRAMQDASLGGFVAEQVYPFHPHYRRVFDEAGIDPWSVKTVEDLQKLPFTYKEDIAPSPEDEDNPRQFVLEPGFDKVKLHKSKGWVPQVGDFKAAGGTYASEQEFREEYQPVIPMFTTGRTAEPTPFFFTMRDLARMHEAGRRLASVISSRVSEDYDDRAVAINNFPGPSHLAYWVALTGAEGGAITTVNTGGGPVLGNERILNIIERVRPTVFMGLPGYTYDIIRMAAAEGRDLSSIEIVAMGGDRITQAAREKIASLLEDMGAIDPVITGAYGCTEMKYAWGDCGDEEMRGYHTCPDMEIIEVVDPESGGVLEPGETGELVVTNLGARGSVVLRYRTGDILVGGYTVEPCPGCGRTMPRISANIVRRKVVKEFALSKIKGNLVNLNTLATLLNENVDVLEWQVEIRKRNDDPEDIDEVFVYVCPTSVGEVAGLCERIVASVRTTFEFTPDHVVIVSYEEIAERLGREGARGEHILDVRA